MQYIKNNHPEVVKIPISEVTSLYYNSVGILMNISYNGGVHRQFNNIIDSLVEIGCDPVCSKVIVHHAAIAYKDKMRGFVVPMNSSHYIQVKKDNPDRNIPTYRKMSSCMEILVSKGWGVLFRGSNKYVNDNSFMSVFNMSDSFLSMFTSKTPKVFPRPPNQDHSSVVQVRSPMDKEGHRKIISGVRGIAPLKRNVRLINSHLSKYTFLCQNVRIYPSLHRVFESNLHSYGRFYFSSQNIPSSLRGGITINGYPVIERDYSNQHFRIVASLGGKVLEDGFNPYEIDKGMVSHTPYNRREREVYKLAMMCILNCKGNYHTAFRNAWEKNLPDFGGIENYKLIIDRLLFKNKFYMDEIKAQNAASLQYIDSCILEFAMLELAEKGIPFLPYHDSLLGKLSDDHSITKAMENGWRKVLGGISNCKIK